MKIKKVAGFLTALMVFALSATASFAANAVVTDSLSADDVYEINNATPGTSKTFLGTRLRGPLTQGATTYAAGDNGNPAEAGNYTTPTTKTFLKTTGASGGEHYWLGDGYQNQSLTVVLVTDGGMNFTITPETKTGFTDVQLDDANDSATLEFIDSTTGWVVTGNAGATIN